MIEPLIARLVVVAAMVTLVAVLALIRVRVPAEERMMAEAFGSDYEDYRRRTRRLIPGLW